MVNNWWGVSFTPMRRNIEWTEFSTTFWFWLLVFFCGHQYSSPTASCSEMTRIRRCRDWPSWPSPVGFYMISFTLPVSALSREILIFVLSSSPMSLVGRFQTQIQSISTKAAFMFSREDYRRTRPSLLHDAWALLGDSQDPTIPSNSYSYW